MPESFGAQLRQRRERQQIALTTIAEQTKIKLSLLEALERDDLSHWPEGIFRRAFVRAYAHAIGLEPDVVVREFLEVHPDPIEVVATASAGSPLAAGADAAWVSAGPPTRFRYLVGAADSSKEPTRNAPGPIRPGEPIVVIHAVHVQSQHHLLMIVYALSAGGPVLGLRQGWQQHARQDGDDGNHDQEFDQRET